ncbi:MAG: alpha/beta fold hydrolase [Alphaproteobacteria bacterium]|nr:alpha/beta fold hydrolase [Alphaproteobacteria bacterium]
MPLAPVNGIELFYEERGESRDGGPPLILLHGLACGRRMWARQMRRYARRWRVIAYDMRGHGRSSAPDDPAAYSAAHLAQDFAGLLDHLRIERASLVGFSMGGGPSIALALAQPKRVASLVLADVGSGADNPWMTTRLAEAWIEHAARGGKPAMVEDMLRGDFFKTYARRSPWARRHMAALICQNPLHGITFTLAGVVAKRKPLFRMKGALARLRVPTLVLAGARDFVCHKAARLLADTIPGALEARIEGAGHMAPLEAPDAFDAAVEGFLGGMSRTG